MHLVFTFFLDLIIHGSADELKPTFILTKHSNLSQGPTHHTLN